MAGLIFPLFLYFKGRTQNCKNKRFVKKLPIQQNREFFYK